MVEKLYYSSDTLILGWHKYQDKALNSAALNTQQRLKNKYLNYKPKIFLTEKAIGVFTSYYKENMS